LRLPHLNRLLSDNPAEPLAGAECAIVAAAEPTIVAALLANPPGSILDLSGRLGPEVEALPGYEGVAW
jgi:GDP-mannose 6-dehydrogenase